MCAAASNNTVQRKIALLIGNNTYNQSPLDNCVNDAKDLSEALKAIGFLVTTKLNLNFEQMDTEIEDFAKSIEPYDLVVFFFSGHGVQCNDRNYLIPCDDQRIQSTPDLKHRAVNAQRILELMCDKNPFVIVCMLDCCRTYSLPSVLKSKGSSATPKGMAAMCATTSTLIAFACAPGTVAIDGSPNNRNGLFTFHLLKHVTRPGKDIIDIVTDVGYEVAKSSKERQLPHVTYGPMPRGVCLASTQNEIAESNSRQGEHNSIFI